MSRPTHTLTSLPSTADPDVVSDICSSLDIPAEDGVRVQPWRRPNLHLRVELLDGGDDLKRQRLSELLSQ
jgi:superfamily II DNA helicase RecQ